MINDPNNKFMQKLTKEGDEGLRDLQQKDIWAQIMMKKTRFATMNEFMNSLTDDEFTEFIQARDVPNDKLAETGRQSESYQ